MSLITIIDTIIWSEVKEIAEMVLITPPPNLGGLFLLGDTPRPPTGSILHHFFSGQKGN